MGAVWAPVFIEDKNEFYIDFTVETTSGSLDNFVVTAVHPEGPWSRPLRLEVAAID